MFIKRGELEQSGDIAALIFASDPTLLSFLFGGEANCLSYLRSASRQAFGQFSANSHWALKLSDKLTNTSPRELTVGVCTTWHTNMPIEFQQATLSSLKNFLSTEQIIHLLAYNGVLDECFAPPKQHQLCLGHMSVAANYQRMGVATALIEHAITQAHKLSKSELVLDVESSNLQALDCYLKAGFSLTKQSVFEPTQQTFSRMNLAV